MADSLAAQLALKAQLPRTWQAFFAQHGTFTAAQLAAIPPLLAGRSALLCAATASGKTAAALAPLVERHCPPVRARRLAIVYLAPTKALVNDLAARLAHPLDTLGLTLGVRTRDGSTLRPARPPDVLLTTPESLDALLTTNARMFAALRAVIIDELHLFDGTPRGDQLIVLLRRLRRIRRYAHAHGDAPDDALQVAALSATLAAPARSAARYAEDAAIIVVPGARRVEAEQLDLAPDDPAALLAYLATFQARGWRKALVFCNSRAEVEAYAAALRGDSAFGSAVFVHYSNIEATRRRAIERQFAEASAALCFASSTLELGVDIGAIDVVLLVGPPGSAASFTQRIGRGNRRGGVTRVACFARSPLERLLFAALLDEQPVQESEVRSQKSEVIRSPASRLPPPVHIFTPSPAHSFRPAVAIQQIFSLIKQSPTAAVRLAELEELFAGLLAPNDVAAILGGLQGRDYLAAGRAGEWKAGPRLNKLVDEQGYPDARVSLYSNVETSGARLIDIRDQHTQQTIARVDALWLDRDVLTLEGRPVNVEWSDGEALWVTSAGGADSARLIYRSARQLLGGALARRLPAQLGLPPDAAPFVAAPQGWYWFHWLGDLHGRAALDLLRYTVRAEETAQPGLCVWLPDAPQAVPEWSAAQVQRSIADNYRTYEPLLALGPFQHLLPVAVRRSDVVAQFDVALFLAALAALRPLRAPDLLAEDLVELAISR